MLELGEAHEDGHYAVGEAAGTVAELLVVVGQDAAGIVAGALDAGMDPTKVHVARDAEQALDVVRPRLRDGDTVLVKASRGVGLDRLVDALRLEIGEAAS